MLGPYDSRPCLDPDLNTWTVFISVRVLLSIIFHVSFLQPYPLRLPCCTSLPWAPTGFCIVASYLFSCLPAYIKFIWCLKRVGQFGFSNSLCSILLKVYALPFFKGRYSLNYILLLQNKTEQK